MIGYTLRSTDAEIQQIMRRQEQNALMVLKHICGSHPMVRALVLVHTTFLYIEDAISPKIKLYNLPCILQTECYAPKPIGGT